MLKTLKPRLVELGKIKIGKKEDNARTSQSGKSWRAPEKLDHFHVTTLERDARGDLKNDDGLMAQLAEAHASPDGKLREIPIAVQSDEIEEILLANYVWYDGKRAVARCDGQNCTWLRDRNGNQISKTVPCDGEHEKLDEKGNRRFKPHGTFHCVIASGGARWGGVYKFRTTSQITIEQLYGCLVHLKSLTGGVLQGLPLSLVVRPMQVAPQGKATTVYVVHVELRGNNLQEVQAQALQLAQYRVAHHRQIAASQAEFRKLLRAPGVDEDDVEQEDVASEFTGVAPDVEAPAAELPPAASHVAERARELAAETGGRVSAGGGMVFVDEDQPPPLPLPDPPKQRRAAGQTVSLPPPTAPTSSKANGATPPLSAIDADQIPL